MSDSNFPDYVISHQGACGRADLLQALVLAEGGEQREMALAALLGYEFVPADISTIETPAPGPITEPEYPLPESKEQPLPTVFQPYRLVTVDNVASGDERRPGIPESSELGNLTSADTDVWDDSFQEVRPMPIVPWTRLWPCLRKAVAQTHETTLDIVQLTDQLSRGTVVRRLPRKKRLSWPNQLPVVLDFSDRLTPYWEDWHWLRQQLQARFNRQFRFYCLKGIPQQQLQLIQDGRPDGKFVDWPTLGAGDTLLLVSDLGMVDPAHPWPIERWQSKLVDYRRRGVRVIVMAPASATQLQPSLVNLANIMRLSPDSSLRVLRRMSPVHLTTQKSDSEMKSAVEMLLAMISIATRVEPALLRALRSVLPEASRDIGLEAEVWCYQDMNTAATACALGAWAVDKWRKKFADLPESLQQRTLDCLRDWHAGLPQAIHHEETLLWRHLAKIRTSQKEEVNAERARGFFIKLKNTLQTTEVQAFQKGTRALQTQLADRHLHWVADTLGGSENYIAELSVAVVQAEPERSREGLPNGVNPVDWLKALPPTELHSMSLLQEADLSLTLEHSLSPRQSQSACSRLATMSLDRDAVLWAWGQNGEHSNYRPWVWSEDSPESVPVLPSQLTIGEKQQSVHNLYIHTGTQRLCFETFNLPDWATAIGQDQYGLYAELIRGKIVQRFRWITPGTFLMGSPDSEAGRSSYRETQHEVTLSQGYWLADSACTQALWIAVMEAENPSYFKDDNKPVEQVRWGDVQQFINNLNRQYPDIAARLPTEAEWEYACRAGTTTDFSFGENISPEQVNYNGGYPYSDGKKGLYREQTIAVKSLPANPWGLYEMHGNIWEWCADWYGDYATEAVKDPVGPVDGVYRVMRGGSWGSGGGGDARSACRGRYEPANRDNRIGFRLALGQAGVSSKLK